MRNAEKSLGPQAPLESRLRLLGVLADALKKTKQDDQAKKVQAQLEQLDLRSRILELGFERIDLRNPDVVAVRPRAPAAPGAPAPAGA